jgi:Xaa-Pro aminopeptidase
MSVKRIAEMRKALVKENLDALVVNHLDYVRYLSGYTGSSGLLVITDKSAHFITDFRYTEQAKKEVTGAKVTIAPGDPVAALKEIADVQKKNLKVGIDSLHLTLAGHKNLSSVLPNALLVAADNLLAELGWVKDKDEITSIRQAAEIGDAAFARVLSMVGPGVRERELAAELEYQMAVMGSERPAFESIVASGYRSAMPHGVATEKKVKKGDFITFDFGATVDGYVSDMTRTVVVGKATARQKKIYNLVLRAQKAGVRKIKAGVACSKIDAACRTIIDKAGFAKEFGHGTGHGIGYFVHVGPRLSAISTDVLKVNNVVTVEPGIYITGWGGVRIEDDVVVTRNGGIVLNKAPKNLLEL